MSVSNEAVRVGLVVAFALVACRKPSDDAVPTAAVHDSAPVVEPASSVSAAAPVVAVAAAPSASATPVAQARSGDNAAARNAEREIARAAASMQVEIIRETGLGGARVDPSAGALKPSGREGPVDLGKVAH